MKLGERVGKYFYIVPQKVRIYYCDIGRADEMPQSMAEAMAEVQSDEVA